MGYAFPGSIWDMNLIIHDCEGIIDPGEPHEIVTAVFYEVAKDRYHTFTRPELLAMDHLPFDTGPRTVGVGFAVGAEAQFMYPLGLRLFDWYLCTQAEDRMRRNICVPRRHVPIYRKKYPNKGIPNLYRSLIDVCADYGIDPSSKEDLDAKALVMNRSWESDPSVYADILAYNVNDVKLTFELLKAMDEREQISVKPALFRGTWTAHTALQEARGLPYDRETDAYIQANYERLLVGMRMRLDPGGEKLTAKGRIGSRWLRSYVDQAGYNGTYPRTPGGAPSAKAALMSAFADERDDETLRSLAMWTQTRSAFQERRGGGLYGPKVGSDGRARYNVWPLSSHTGRTFGKGSEAVMQMAKWRRGLVVPPEGRALIELDYSAQETGIAAGESE